MCRRRASPGAREIIAGRNRAIAGRWRRSLQETAPNVQTAIEVRYGLGTVYKQQGDYDRALRELAVALDLATEQHARLRNRRVC